MPDELFTLAARPIITKAGYAERDLALWMQWVNTQLTTGAEGGLSAVLEEQVASGSASLDFTEIDAAYDDYLVILDGLVPGTANDHLWLRVSTDGGATYVSSASYSWTAFAWRAGGSGATGFETGETKIDLSGFDVTANAAFGVNGAFYLQGPLSERYTRVLGQTNYETSSGGTFRVGINVTGAYEAVTPVTAFQLLMSTGTIASGSARVYGLTT